MNKKKSTNEKLIDIYNRKPRQSRIDELQLANNSLCDNVIELEKILRRNKEYIQSLELEIAMVREKNLNFVEAINLISRAERLRVQGNLYAKHNVCTDKVKPY